MKLFFELCEYFSRFPIRVTAGSFVVFSAISLLLAPEYKLAVFIIFAAAFLIIFVPRFFGVESFERASSLLPPCVAGMAAILVSALYFGFYLGKADSYAEAFADTPCEIIMTVTNIRSESDYFSSYDVKIERINGKRVIYNGRLNADYYAGPARGERVSALCTLSRMPDDYDGSEISLIADGIALYAHMDGDYVTLDRKVFSLGGLISSARIYLTSIIESRVGGEEAGFVAAILLGERGELPPTLARDMRRLGISHLLAISGLHISILLGVVSAVLNAIVIKRSVKNAIIFALIPLFMALTGFSPSVTRCSIMTILAIIGGQRGKIGSITSLFIAAALIILVNPPAAADVGLMLSVTATFGILKSGVKWKRSMTERFKGREPYARLLKKIFVSSAITLSAIIYTLPVTAVSFGEVSLLSPIANLVFIPLVEAILTLSPLIFAAFIPPLARIAGAAVKYISRLFIYAANYCALRVNLSFSLKYRFVIFVAFLTLIAWLTVIIIRRAAPFKRSTLKRLGLIPIAVFIGSYACFYCAELAQSSDLEAFYINRGVSDGFVLNKGRERFVIDISDGSYVFARALVDAAENENGSDIYAYILTHLHNRQLKSVERTAARLFIKKLVMPAPVTDSDKSIAYALAELCEKLGITAVVYPHSVNSTVFLGDIGVEIAAYTSHQGSAHPVITFSAGDGEQSFAYFGGSTFETELKAYDYALLGRVNFAVMGMHSPVMHKQISLEALSAPHSAFYFANDEIAAKFQLPLGVQSFIYQNEPLKLF